jgi:general secretion pathway protein M
MISLADLKNRYAELDEDLRRLMLILLATVALAVIAYSAVQQHLSQLERRKLSREATLAELMSLRVRHQEAQGDANRVRNRLALVTPEDSPTTVIEQTGIATRAAIQSKTLPRQERDGLIEEAAEITVAGLSSNELVNLLFRLEQHPKPVVVKRFVARPRFNEPARLDLTMTVSLYRPGPAAERQ